MTGFLTVWRMLRAFADPRGVASVEFAISIPVVLILMGWLYDVSNLLVARIQLSNGVGNATSYAQLAGAAASTSTLISIATGTSQLTGATATATGPSCYCVTYNPTALTAASCGASCSNGLAAQKYFTVTGTYTYVPVLPGLSALTNTVLTEQASVMVQ